MKAQFWSMDMIFAVMIFMGGIVLLSYVWSNVNSQFSISYGYGIGLMQIQLNNLLQRIQAQGSPQNWNSYASVNNTNNWANVSVGLGSSSTPGTISMNKVLTLMAMSNSNYQASKQLLGVGYDYYITIYSQGQYNLSIGRNPMNLNPTSIQSATIPIVLDNGQDANMRVIVWTNTTFGVG